MASSSHSLRYSPIQGSTWNLNTRIESIDGEIDFNGITSYKAKNSSDSIFAIEASYLYRFEKNLMLGFSTEYLFHSKTSQNISEQGRGLGDLNLSSSYELALRPNPIVDHFVLGAGFVIPTGNPIEKDNSRLQSKTTGEGLYSTEFGILITKFLGAHAALTLFESLGKYFSKNYGFYELNAGFYNRWGFNFGVYPSSNREFSATFGVTYKYKSSREMKFVDLVEVESIGAAREVTSSLTLRYNPRGEALTFSIQYADSNLLGLSKNTSLKRSFEIGLQNTF